MKSSCPKCGRTYEVEDKLNGSTAQCECGEKFVLEENSQEKQPLVIDQNNQDYQFNPPKLCRILEIIEILCWIPASYSFIILAYCLSSAHSLSDTDFSRLAWAWPMIILLNFSRNILYFASFSAHNTRMILKKMR